MYLGFSPLSPTRPVFTCRSGDSILYYAPGFILRAISGAQAAVEAEIAGDAPRAPLIKALVRQAEEARIHRDALFSQPYEPVCLTIYLDNRCNLACTYCYSDPAMPGSGFKAPVSLEAIGCAAALVAAGCVRRGLPLTLVAHGGGEPTLNWHLLREALRVVDETAARFRITTFKYLATNGVIPMDTLRWVAAHFDLVGLSCDGPADIQHNQRPRPNGTNSTRFVERSADFLHEMDTAFHARVTITRNTVTRQEEIAAYVCQRLAPQEIHIEPVYMGGRERASLLSPGNSGDLEGLADTFVTHFLRAQDCAGLAGIPLQYSGSRPWDIHGPFCQIFRDVLQLVPGDIASPCFKLSDAQQVAALNGQIGCMVGRTFTLDLPKIQSLRFDLLQQTAFCQGCFNQYHCAQACPDGCGLEKSAQNLPTFRCQLQMRLAGAIIQRAASRLAVTTTSPLAAAPVRIRRYG